MGLFDGLKNMLKSDINSAANRTVNNAVNSANRKAEEAIVGAVTGKGRNSKQAFTFASLPKTLEELQALPEASLDSAFKTSALVVATLCNYPKNPEESIKMLNFLKGPESFNPSEQAFVAERLKNQPYKPFSFFEGATVDNGYKATAPYKIYIYENPYSFDEENWATMYVKSAGADSERPIKLRKKPSTGQWFLNDIQCLAEIRLPKEDDPWA